MCVCHCFSCTAHLQKRHLYFYLLFSCSADPRKDRRERERERETQALAATPIPPLLPTDVFSLCCSPLMFFLQHADARVQPILCLTCTPQLPSLKPAPPPTLCLRLEPPPRRLRFNPCPFVCLLFGLSAGIHKGYKKISTNLGGRMGYGPRRNPLNVGLYPSCFVWDGCVQFGASPNQNPTLADLGLCWALVEVCALLSDILVAKSNPGMYQLHIFLK